MYTFLKQESKYFEDFKLFFILHHLILKYFYFFYLCYT
jgi:hypothetical protein